MSKYTQSQLRWLFDAVKNGMRKSDVMKKLYITSDEAITMYAEASKIFGYGPYGKKRELSDDPAPVKPVYKIPPATYTNKTRDQLIDEILSRDIEPAKPKVSVNQLN